MTTVIHIREAPKGWKNDDKYFYVGRPSIFGNPFSHLDGTLAEYKVSTRDEVVDMFEKYFYQKIKDDVDFYDKVQVLKDKVLLCFCHPQRCHADVIAKYLDTKNENT